MRFDREPYGYVCVNGLNIPAALGLESITFYRIPNIKLLADRMVKILSAFHLGDR